MISVNNLSLYFGGQDIFSDVSFMIHKGEKIGLVGKNGSGKSTLLKVLSKEQSPNSGNLNFPKDLIIGYLPQDLDFYDGRTVIAEVKTVFVHLNNIEKKIAELQKQLESRTDYESSEYLNIINDFNILEEKFRINGGYEIESQISHILDGLGFSYSDYNRYTNEFSGGWRMRLELAKILLKKPDLILLDEPTNHLDIESIIWLEKWLLEYNGTVLLVSHDKMFLNALTNRTIEISFSKLNDYKVSYSKYLKLREDRILKQSQAKKNQDKYIKETQILINKFRAKKNKASFAQSLIKKLEKLEIIEIEKVDDASMKFQFAKAPRSGKINLIINQASKSYEDLNVLKDVKLELVRGDRVAFVGKNGQGKTTLIKMIMNEIDFSGKIEFGHQVKLGYYAQNQVDFLDNEKTILETIEESIDIGTNKNPRSILGSFLFSNEDVDKKVKVLSGGERARVALCKLLLKPINLLIMDEPTNHLDITSKNLLKKALQEYDGTLILVSHDRDFLSNLTDKVYEFYDKNIKEYIGDIDVFLKEKKLNNLKQLEKQYEANANTKNKKSEKNTKKQINLLSKKISSLERQIEKLENNQKNDDFILSDPIEFKKLSKSNDFFQKYENRKNKINNLLDEWNCQIELLEKLKKTK
ncbi:MAG: glycosyl transferase family 2 [Flavobacteriales bacterium]|nr:glycosyl transferase family 2 [Flavobacteriales bacterium]|tara:strand:- start:1474 stop:3393 length:1920 start_codon:yes stop_codon:yes gene_type:complete